MSMWIIYHWDTKNAEKIYFPIQTSDMDIIVQNQRLAKIKFKGLSSEYKEALIGLVEEIDNNNSSNIKRVFRQLEKGV